MIEVNVTNKNDLIKIIGPPSTISDFNKNLWFYFERLKTNQSLLKLGAQKIKENNILIVELNNKGILKSKRILDLDDMNDVEYLKTVTTKEFQNDNCFFLKRVFGHLKFFFLQEGKHHYKVPMLDGNTYRYFFLVFLVSLYKYLIRYKYQNLSFLHRIPNR